MQLHAPARRQRRERGRNPRRSASIRKRASASRCAPAASGPTCNSAKRARKRTREKPKTRQHPRRASTARPWTSQQALKLLVTAAHLSACIPKTAIPIDREFRPLRPLSSNTTTSTPISKTRRRRLHHRLEPRRHRCSPKRRRTRSRRFNEPKGAAEGTGPNIRHSKAAVKVMSGQATAPTSPTAKRQRERCRRAPIRRTLTMDGSRRTPARPRRAMRRRQKEEKETRQGKGRRRKPPKANGAAKARRQTGKVGSKTGQS